MRSWVTMAMGLLLALVACKEHDWQAAETAARSYAKRIKGATGEVECAHKDSDGDGYCSCSVFLEGGGVEPIDCGCEVYCVRCAEGCKLQDTYKALGEARRGR